MCQATLGHVLLSTCFKGVFCNTPLKSDGLLEFLFFEFLLKRALKRRQHCDYVEVRSDGEADNHISIQLGAHTSPERFVASGRNGG